MEEKISIVPSKTEDHRSLIFRVLIAFLCVVVFIGIVEFALYKYIVPKVTQVNDITVTATEIEVFVEKNPGANKIYYKTEKGRWVVYVKAPDNLITEIKRNYERDDKMYNYHERLPNAFELTINWVHYVVFGLITAGFIGYYIYWYFAIEKFYARQKLDAKPKKSTVEILPVIEKNSEDAKIKQVKSVQKEIKSETDNAAKTSSKPNTAKAAAAAKPKTAAPKTGAAKTTGEAVKAKTTKPKATTAKTAPKTTAKTK